MGAFDNIKALSALLGNAQQIREKVQQMQAELARLTVEGDAGAGAIRVVANGAQQVVSVRIDPAAVRSLVGNDADAQTNQRMLEDLIAAAVNDALAKARKLMQQEMLKATGGLNLPGLTPET